MAPQHCARCSARIAATARFCSTCGLRLTHNQPILALSDAHDVLAAGTRLGRGSYAVGKLLGRGGFGITYLGADHRLSRPIALKEFFPAGSGRQGTLVIPPHTLPPPAYAAATSQFLQEAQMVARFHHPSIVAVHDVFEENATVYLVMEYLRGETLAQRLERRGQPLSEAELIDLATPLATALELIHAANLLHRDIKPANIMVVGEQPSLRPVLIDFGAARTFALGQTMHHSVMLTPGYAPLEQYGERAQRGPFSDMYALAATFYHLATGHEPPPATDRAVGIELKPPRSLNPSLSRGFEHALLHALEMQPAQRTASATAFLRELTSSKSRNTIARRPPVMPEPPIAQPAEQPQLRRVQALAQQLAAEAQPPNALHCPICRSAHLIEPALGVGLVRCPICRAAGLRQRVPSLGVDHCPACTSGQLAPDATPALLRCPACRVGYVQLYTRRRALVWGATHAQCDLCQADFAYNQRMDTLTLERLPHGPGELLTDLLGQTKARSEWQRLARRSLEAIKICQHCHAEFDQQPNQRWRWIARNRRLDQVPRAYRDRAYRWQEWMKITHGVPPEGGTHVCPGCTAQFDALEPEQLTLLQAPQDPWSVGRTYAGQTLPTAVWRSIAAGQRQPERPGLICPACTTELERVAPDIYTLIAFDPQRDRFGDGQRYHRQRLGWANWQRIAQGQPLAPEPAKLRAIAQQALWAAFLSREWSIPGLIKPLPKGFGVHEHVLLTLPVSQQRPTKQGWYQYDAGDLWFTNDKLIYAGGRGKIIVPLNKISRCEIESATPGQLVALSRIDRVKPLYFLSALTTHHTLGGLRLPLQWDAEHVVALINHVCQTA